MGCRCHQVVQWLVCGPVRLCPFPSAVHLKEPKQKGGLHHGTWCQLLSHLSSFTPGNLCMVTGGANLGRIGVITNRERHPGSFDVVHVKDANGNSFATRLSNIFVIGKA